MLIHVIAHEKFLAWFRTRIAGLVGGCSSTALAGPGKPQLFIVTTINVIIRLLLSDLQKFLSTD